MGIKKFGELAQKGNSTDDWNPITQVVGTFYAGGPEIYCQSEMSFAGRSFADFCSEEVHKAVEDSQRVLVDAEGFFFKISSNPYHIEKLTLKQLAKSIAYNMVQQFVDTRAQTDPKRPKIVPTKEFHLLMDAGFNVVTEKDQEKKKRQRKPAKKPLTEKYVVTRILPEVCDDLSIYDHYISEDDTSPLLRRDKETGALYRTLSSTFLKDIKCKKHFKLLVVEQFINNIGAWLSQTDFRYVFVRTSRRDKHYYERDLVDDTERYLTFDEFDVVSGLHGEAEACLVSEAIRAHEARGGNSFCMSHDSDLIGIFTCCPPRVSHHMTAMVYSKVTAWKAVLSPEQRIAHVKGHSLAVSYCLLGTDYFHREKVPALFGRNTVNIMQKLKLWAKSFDVTDARITINRGNLIALLSKEFKATKSITKKVNAALEEDCNFGKTVEDILIPPDQIDMLVFQINYWRSSFLKQPRITLPTL